MRGRGFAGGIADHRAGGQHAAQLAQFVEGAMQAQRVAGLLSARGGDGVAEFLQGVLLEREARLLVDLASLVAVLGVSAPPASARGR